MGRRQRWPGSSRIMSVAPSHHLVSPSHFSHYNGSSILPINSYQQDGCSSKRISWKRHVVTRRPTASPTNQLTACHFGRTVTVGWPQSDFACRFRSFFFIFISFLVWKWAKENHHARKPPILDVSQTEGSRPKNNCVTNRVSQHAISSLRFCSRLFFRSVFFQPCFFPLLAVHRISDETFSARFSLPPLRTHPFCARKRTARKGVATDQ